MITFKEALKDLRNRMMKQLGETVWTIERVTPMNRWEVEEFQGKGVKKRNLMKALTKDLKERMENIEAIDKILRGGKIIEKYSKKVDPT